MSKYKKIILISTLEVGTIVPHHIDKKLRHQ